MNETEEKPKTVRELLRVSAGWLTAQGVEAAGLDTQLLLAHALGCRRLDLFLQHDRGLQPDELERFRALMRRRGQLREPVAYILGKREFFGLELSVSPAVLVPRPETEHLIEVALEEIDRRIDRRSAYDKPVAREPELDGELPEAMDEAPPEDEPAAAEDEPAAAEDEPAAAEDAPAQAALTIDVADVGTGSGCVALAVAKLRPVVRAVASDVSEEALTVARANAEATGLSERVSFVHADLLEHAAPASFDLILSNPPYIGDDEADLLAPEVRDHEPHGALFDRPGLPLTARLVEQAKEALRPGGLLVIETGYTSAGRVAEFFTAAGYQEVRCVPDLAGIERVVVGRLPC